VLLNGRRLSNYAFLSGTVDLGTIPLSAIERVEILKDGVIVDLMAPTPSRGGQFITRKDFDWASS
jgi:iron complex outermembrane receptor protein